MKSNTLQLKKALSAALFILLLSVVGTKNALAQNQVATLQHGDSITGVYYGESAFNSAYSAAVNGDIITLSSGTFSCVSISKSITVRGAGCVLDTLTQVVKTQVTGNFFLNIGAANSSFEGIHFSGTIGMDASNVSFEKCNIYTISFYSGHNIFNWQFVNCIIKNCSSTASGEYSAMGLSFINSVVRFVGYRHTNINYANTFNNSIVLFNNGLYIKNIVAYNSIFATVSDHTVSGCTFFNCIGIKTGETSLFSGQTTTNVMEMNGYEDVFETFTGTVTYNNNYQLKEDIATSFLGHDGTEVGIYGGVMPYRTRPNYMIIKSCNVAGRTSEDNKLGVEIELLNAGE